MKGARKRTLDFQLSLSALSKAKFATGEILHHNRIERKGSDPLRYFEGAWAPLDLPRLCSYVGMHGHLLPSCHRGDKKTVALQNFKILYSQAVQASLSDPHPKNIGSEVLRSNMRAISVATTTTERMTMGFLPLVRPTLVYI